MPKKINITINGKKYKADSGQSILDVARANDIYITTLCHHPDLKIQGSCRLCNVEIKGKNGLHTSCSTEVSDGMKITTDSPNIKRARKINLELILVSTAKNAVIVFIIKIAQSVIMPKNTK